MTLNILKRPSNGNDTKTPIISAWLALIGYIIILCGAGIWYYLYVEDRRAFLTQRNFRILAEAGQNLSDTVEGHAQILKALANGIANKGENVGSISDTCKQLIDDSHFKKVELEIVSNGKRTNVPCPKSNYLDVPSKVSHEKTDFIISQFNSKIFFTQTKFNLHLERTLHGARLTIQKEVPGECPGNNVQVETVVWSNESQNEKIIKNPCSLQLRGELDLDTFLQRLPIDDIFADLLLADSNGTVIYQKSSTKHATSLKFQLLDILTQHENVGLSMPTTGGRSSLPSSGKRDLHKAQYVDDSLLKQVPSISTISFGDDTLLFFTQPGFLPFPRYKNGSEDIAFILGGLVPSRTFRADAMAIPTPILLPSVFAFFALTFSLPLLKLWSMGPKDRLTIVDVVSLMFFSLMGTALLTFGLADLYAYSTAERKLDDRLIHVSGKIQAGFTDELRLVLNELKKQDTNYASAYKVCNGNPNEKRVVRPDFLKYYWKSGNQIEAACKSEGKKNEIKVKGGNKATYEYPYFNGLFWVTPDGEVANYFTIAKAGINSPNLKERQYVQRVLENRLYRLETESSKKRSHSFFIEPIYSWTSGKNEVVISIKSEFNDKTTAGTQKAIWTESVRGRENPVNPPAGDDNPSPQIAVAAMEGKLLSLMYPVVPPGFGYAIIDEDGKVLFHSDMRRNLRENLFSETNQDRRLRSLVLARNADNVDVTYAGNDTQFYVAPIGSNNLDLPWTLIVYRDKNLLRTANGVALFISTVLFALYATVILGGLLFGLLIVGDLRSGQASWMWPKEVYHRRYTTIALINSALVLIFGGLMLTGNGQAILLRAMAFAFIGMSVMYYILNFERLISKIRTEKYPRHLASKCNELLKRYSPQSYTTSYTWMVMTFMLIFSAVPSLSIFMVAFDEEMLLLNQYLQNFREQSLQQRENDIQNSYMRVDFDEAGNNVTDHLLNKGMHLGFNVHEIFLPTRSPEDASVPEFSKKDKKDNLVGETLGVLENSYAYINRIPKKMEDKISKLVQRNKKNEPDNSLVEWLHEELRPFYNDSSEQTGGFLPIFPETSASTSSLFSKERYTYMGRGLIIVALVTMGLGVLDALIRKRLVLIVISLVIVGLVFHLAIAPNNLVQKILGVSGGFGMVWVILPLMFLIVLYRLPNFISQRIFYLGYQMPEGNQSRLLDGAKSQDLIIRLQASVFFHAHDKSYQGELLQHLCSHTSTRLHAFYFRMLSLFHPHIIFIDPLTHMWEEQDKNIRILRRLERYHMKGRTVWLVSPIDLLNWSYRQFSADPDSKSTRDYRQRWTKILAKFKVVFWTPEWELQEQHKFEEKVFNDLAGENLNVEQIRIFTDECKVSPEHRKYGDTLLEEKSQLSKMLACTQAKDKVPLFILDALAGEYRAWWSICSDTEKLALYHLATDRFLNSQNPGVRTLLQKNLILLNPDLQMINESFRQFVLNICEEEEFALLERTGPTSIWKKLVWPMGGLIILFAIFLISTQQDIRAVALAFIPALPALFGILLKKFGSSSTQGTASMGEA
ncbi:MAG: hypothetical protein NPIRA03_10540 [Nitrospirales bacterium]|nr:MAG: hypothetical protein NPIRA03_10540 [Nitrospirales bacterium]